ncbi:hypothetical protein GCM10009122_02950 [Fulvivirga kasyanovii]|uniref:Polymerase nucleotidyl transferase domain-containing protein n=1 Tax=Fulvivirga kasyanovii TaxID=396812 RepID=A0ABW9RS22_9BACT|nr:nucleotidyltransferase domain-containing protein [Fulvivirga kasyanovii]MTI26501.1 hypothetical protein [Fulvivirga kasyanovii]
MDPFLLKHIDEIQLECQKNGVSKLYAFGSVVDGRFKPGKSDIDLLVEFDSNEVSQRDQAKCMLRLWINLQNLLNSKVDLVSKGTVNGKFFKKYLELYKELIFEKEGNYEIK